MDFLDLEATEESDRDSNRDSKRQRRGSGSTFEFSSPLKQSKVILKIRLYKSRQEPSWAGRVDIEGNYDMKEKLKAIEVDGRKVMRWNKKTGVSWHNVNNVKTRDRQRGSLEPKTVRTADPREVIKAAHAQFDADPDVADIELTNVNGSRLLLSEVDGLVFTPFGIDSDSDSDGQQDNGPLNYQPVANQLTTLVDSHMVKIHKDLSVILHLCCHVLRDSGKTDAQIGALVRACYDKYDQRLARETSK